MSTRVEIKGVPGLVGPSIDGRCAGGIIFRVGHADETLASAGITHLVEHLALHFSDPTKVHSNGFTGPLLTHFHINGTREEVGDFLGNVCSALRALPLERLQTEKSILRAEARRRGNAVDQIHAWRFGARDYGLASFEEMGLHRLGAEEVEAWTREWFTTGNAMVWLATDEVPEGLDLALPDGRRMPTPIAESWLPETPAHYIGADGIVAGSALVPRSTAARVFSSVLEQALFRELRKVGGYSYAPSATYEPLDHAVAAIYTVADALPENQDAVVGGIVDVLAQLRVGQVADADIRAAVENAKQMLTHPDAASLRLPADVSNELLGHALPSDDQLLAELDAVDASSIRAVAQQFHESVLLQVPRRPVDWAGYAAAPEWNGIRANGRGHAFVDHPEAAIHLDDSALAVETPEGSTGVRWDEVVAVQAYPDGARTVHGRDGFQVHLEPTLLAGGGREASDEVDRRVRPELVVPMPARDPDRIPQPDRTADSAEIRRTAGPPDRDDTGPRWAQVAAAIVGVLALGTTAVFLWGLIQHLTDDGTGAGELSDVAMRGVRAGLLALLYLWLRKKARGQD